MGKSRYPNVVRFEFVTVSGKKWGGICTRPGLEDEPDEEQLDFAIQWVARIRKDDLVIPADEAD